MGITAETLAPLDPGLIRRSVLPAVQRGVEHLWSVEGLRWAELAADRLTDLDRSVVRYITYIEDHIPGYLDWLLKAFPVAGADGDVAEFCANREYFRFFVAWAYDEERHASALTRYQLAAGIAEDENDFTLELAAEGIKQFSLPYEHPLQAFTYTLIQEKATQLFYQRFMDAVQEPVLRELLRLMARDEARHFALYGRLVSAYLARDGARAIPHLRDVVGTFRMPLATTLTGYRRWSLQVADAVGYDHTETYSALARIVADFSTHSSEADRPALLDFVEALRRLA